MTTPSRPSPKVKVKKNDVEPKDKTSRSIEVMVAERQLKDLMSVNRSTLKFFELLGIKTVAELAQCEAKELFGRLCKLSAEPHGLCTEDVFSAAIAQAKNPNLASEKCDWWYWNRRRKRNPRKGML